MSVPGSARGGAQASTWVSRLPLIALISAVIAGPLGIGLGAWALARARRMAVSLPALAVAAVGIGIVQTSAVTIWAASGGGPLNSSLTSSATTSEWTYPTTPPPTGPANPSPEPPSRPRPTNIEQIAPPRVNTYEAKGFSADPGPVTAGAIAAERGNYTSPKDTIGVTVAQWPTEAEAQTHAQEGGVSDYGPDALRTSGVVSFGSYWYYELNDKGTVYWNQGNFSASFTGKPLQVQEFFLSFPKY